MGITYQDDAATQAFTTGSIAATIDVAEGDLIVVFIGVANKAVWCTGVTDDIGNSYTVRTAIIANLGATTLVFAYVLSSAGADATNVITVTFNNATAANKQLIISCYEPDSGDIVTLEDSANAVSGWEASPWETPSTINTTGTDELLIAGFQANVSTLNYSNHEIPSGVAADGVFSLAPEAECFYRILTGTISNAEAEMDTDGSQYYVAEILAFKSTATAPGGIVVLRRRRM